MNRRAVDLFDDPPWPTEVTIDQPAGLSARPWLVAALLFSGAFLYSMALPWFTSAESPAWTPFSHWLDLGSAPGTQKWGYLMLGVAICVPLGIAAVIPTPGKGRLSLLLLIATGLVVVTLLEGNSQLRVDPGPLLHADYGAWIGRAAAVMAWFSITGATLIGWLWPTNRSGRS